MQNQEQQPKQNGINIEISEEMVAEGAYANPAVNTHSYTRFVIDFVNRTLSTPKRK